MMKTKQLFTALLASGAFLMSASAMADDENQVLTGDTRLACEAILCLSSAHRPGECNPALHKYFDITGRHMLSKRRNFLNLCPASKEPNMPGLVDAIVNAAGRCNAAYQNAHNGFKPTAIGRGRAPTLPSYCQAYFNHPYTEVASIKFEPTYCTSSNRDRGINRTRYSARPINSNSYMCGGKWVDVPAAQ